MGFLPSAVVELQILRIAEPFPLVECESVSPVGIATDVKLKDRHNYRLLVLDMRRTVHRAYTLAGRHRLNSC